MLQTFVNQLVAQVGLVVGVLSTFIVGPGFALAFLLYRKKQRRDQRRSPIGIDLLRSAGHSLQEQLEVTANDMTFDVLTLSVLPLVILALFLAQGHVQRLAAMYRVIPFYVGLILAAICRVTWEMIRAGEHLDKLRAGYDAELAVGQELDQLMRQGGGRLS